MISPTVAASLALLKLVQAGVSPSGVTGTVYYDTTSSCGKDGDVDSGVGDYSTITAHVGACGYSVDQLAALDARDQNRMVAFDAALMENNKAALCGKEIQVTKADGTVFQFSDGPLFIGDACPACAGGVKLDLSAKALVEIGGDCKVNPPGLSYQVLDTMAGPEFSSISGGSLGTNSSNFVGSSASVPGVGSSSALGVATSIPGAVASSALGVPPVPPVSSVLADPSTQLTPSVPSAISSPPIPTAIPSVPSALTVPTVPTVPAGAPSDTSLLPGVGSAPSLPVGMSSSPSLPAGVKATGLPGMALFAEGEAGSNASCKRRKRRRLEKSH
ncbi:hypothetical protein I302_106375 [Kwoniella bestiolae CBS 10118]|uniref:Barwin domain-containing protein n=1 Tax=Kwoniella bestiolae CBS 10118 TaxID=1296100 RepID=A0A1B9G3R9_9TREE|nr:hypothetical protein I302_05498 [Kwoniella bestiolae CBS 10118]OCF25674.1 hypothetical protein I302_05498 [Kwoniella bestiolae CBS 10118]